MKAFLYVDSVSETPVISAVSETLSDGSAVWNLVCGGIVIPCISEKHADAAFDAIAEAVKSATSEKVVTQ